MKLVFCCSRRICQANGLCSQWETCSYTPNRGLLFAGGATGDVVIHDRSAREMVTQTMLKATAKRSGEPGGLIRSRNCLSLVTAAFISLKNSKFEKQVIILFPGVGTSNFLTEDHSEMHARCLLWFLEDKSGGFCAGNTGLVDVAAGGRRTVERNSRRRLLSLPGSRVGRRATLQRKGI